jgi:hypothetical protein
MKFTCILYFREGACFHKGRGEEGVNRLLQSFSSLPFLFHEEAHDIIHFYSFGFSALRQFPHQRKENQKRSRRI